MSDLDFMTSLVHSINTYYSYYGASTMLSSKDIKQEKKLFMTSENHILMGKKH